MTPAYGSKVAILTKTDKNEKAHARKEQPGKSEKQGRQKA